MNCRRHSMTQAMADIAEIGRRMAAARQRGAAILLLMGGHVIRAGVARQLIDLMERGLITHIGMNGAGPIHDYELARVGATCESVARYIRTRRIWPVARNGRNQRHCSRGCRSAAWAWPNRSAATFLNSDYPHKDTQRPGRRRAAERAR